MHRCRNMRLVAFVAIVRSDRVYNCSKSMCMAWWKRFFCGWGNKGVYCATVHACILLIIVPVDGSIFSCCAPCITCFQYPFHHPSDLEASLSGAFLVPPRSIGHTGRQSASLDRYIPDPRVHNWSSTAAFEVVSWTLDRYRLDHVSSTLDRYRLDHVS